MLSIYKKGQVYFRFGLLLFLLMNSQYLLAQNQDQLSPRIQEIVKPGSKKTFLKFKSSTRIKPAAFVSEYKTDLGLSARDELKITKAEDDELGFTHHHSQQYHGNVPVEFAEMKIHEKNGKVISIGGRVISNIDVNTSPFLPEEDALALALQFIGAEEYAWEVDYLEKLYQQKQRDPKATLYPEGELVVTCPASLDESKGENYVLAWKFDIHDASLNSANTVYVDASVGAIVNSIPLTLHTCTPGTGTTNFYGTKAVQSDKPMGSAVFILDASCAATNNVRIHTQLLGAGGALTEFSDSNNVWDTVTQQSAVTSHWGMTEAVRYFKAVHARNSYDGSGGDIDIHQGAQFPPSGNNATFNSSLGLMRIGVGPTNAPGDDINAYDVVVHELAHGVTGTSAGLVYRREPGGLNESFSDIFGTAAEFWTLGGDWALGGDLAIGAIRSMSNPNAFNQPDTYGGTFWWNPNCGTPTSANDYCGVHVNSGVQNFWFYLLSVGGSGTNDIGDDYNVKGIGISKAARIAYRNLTNYLSSGSDFNDARDNSIQAAEDIFGECSEEVISTTNAWYAVGVGDPALMIDSVSIENTACDKDTGIIFIRVIGVEGTAQYQWDDPMMQTTDKAVDLAKGTYGVTITDDANSCMIDSTFEVEEDANFTLDVSVNDVTTCGGDDGDATANLTGVVGTPTIMWSNGDNTPMISMLVAGDYSVSVTDTSTMCNLDTMVEVKEPEIEVNIAGGGTRTFCEDDNDREITLSATVMNCGGCTFSWSTGATSESIMVTTKGTYSVTAMDTSGCSGMASTDVTIFERDCDDCDVNAFWRFFGFGDCDEWEIDRLHAVDPNDITGSSGYSVDQWVSINDNLGYSIRFENDPDFATAPAQVVKIDMPVDSNFNIFSFSLESYGFGDYIFEVPPNSTFYSTRIDLVDSLGIYVDFTAGIDVTKNEAFWLFESIDPLTNLPPEDALTGFLPVNDTTITIYNDTLTQQGEGFVNFSIKPKRTLVTGDSLAEQATIIFDINEPLATNTWRNLVDAFPPVSGIDSLELLDNNVIKFYWSGADDVGGVGIDFYDLYGSKDSSDFSLYAERVDTNVYEFVADEGSVYSFFTIATDYVGNEEKEKEGPDNYIILNSGIKVAAKVFLQGPYDANLGLMKNQLRENDLLPTTEPFTALGFTHVDGGGGEIVSPAVFDTTGNNAIMDWIFLELRDGNQPDSVVATRAALLQVDGDIVDVDGISAVGFDGKISGNYYLAIRHRNHLGVRTANPVSLGGIAGLPTDFTDINLLTFGVNAQVNIAGVHALYAGNANHDAQVNAVDKNAYWRIQNGQTFDYLIFTADFNLDGAVNAVDKNLYWRINNSRTQQLD